LREHITSITPPNPVVVRSDISIRLSWRNNCLTTIVVLNMAENEDIVAMIQEDFEDEEDDDLIKTFALQ